MTTGGAAGQQPPPPPPPPPPPAGGTPQPFGPPMGEMGAGMPPPQGTMQPPPQYGGYVPPGGYQPYADPSMGGYAPPPPPGMYPPAGGYQPPPSGYAPPQGYAPQGGYPPQGMPPGQMPPPPGPPGPPPPPPKPANFQLGTMLPPQLKVKVPAHSLQFDEQYFLRLLAGSISLTKDEKARIVESIPKLKQSQIDELIRIFEEEKKKFAELGEEHVPQLQKLATQHYQDWVDIEMGQEQAAKKAAEASQAEELKKKLGLN